MIISPTLPDDIENTIVKAFNLEGLIAGDHRILNEKGEIIDRFRVDSITIIELREYYRVPVTIALSLCYEWYDDVDELGNDIQVVIHHCKGVLIAPPSRPPMDRKFIGANPIQAIDMEAPVTLFKCLENFNILADHPLSYAMGAGNDGYIVHIYAHQGKVALSYWGQPQSQNMREFHKAIIETIKQMAQIYADEEITELINRNYSIPF